MNGQAVDLGAVMRSVANPEVVRVLETLLADARAGKLAAVGVVSVPGPGQMG